MEVGIDTVEDLILRCDELAKYLTWRWLRFTRDDVDRTNTTRSTVSEFWRRTRGAFQAWTQRPYSIPLVKRVGKGTRARDMVRQAVGCLVRAAAETIVDEPVDEGTGEMMEPERDHLLRSIKLNLDCLIQDIIGGAEDIAERVGDKLDAITRLRCEQVSAYLSGSSPG